MLGLQPVMIVILDTLLYLQRTSHVIIEIMMIADYGNITWRTSLARSMQVDIINALRRGDWQ